MGKSTEALYSPANTDDDDVEQFPSGSTRNNNGPATVYRDDPQSGYRDVPTNEAEGEGSIFDWGESGTASNSSKSVGGGGTRGGVASDFDADADVSFSPISLEDNDDDGDSTDEDTTRLRSNNKLNQRVFDSTCYDDDTRIFVGGGWGRHGSQNACPCASRVLCCLCNTKGPTSSGRSRSPMCKLMVMVVAFVGSVIGFGYLGYEAGQPVLIHDGSTAESGDSVSTDMHHHTKGEEWLEWVEHPKEHLHVPDIHWPHHIVSDKKNNGNNGRSSNFPPMSQTQLLKLSEHIFQSCSERSLLTIPGRDACIQACHGRYCCFEKDAEYGSCVTEPNSYCFAFAACENAIMDFAMSNVNTKVEENERFNSHDGMLKSLDVKLLEATCDEGSIATLDGIRDCTAFCQHHLCCFSEDDTENCRDDHPGECQAYDSCKILVDRPDAPIPIGEGSIQSPGNNEFAGSVVIANPPPSSSSAAQDVGAIRTAVNAVCDVNEVKAGDDSWVTACHALCANYLCCFSTIGTQSNCRDVYGNAVCNAYSGCSVLHGDESAVSNSIVLPSPPPPPKKYVPHRPEAQNPQIFPDDVKEVNEVCTNRVQYDITLRDSCQRVCDSRKCCYTSGPGNCYMLDTEWCDEFQACQLLFN